MVSPISKEPNRLSLCTRKRSGNSINQSDWYNTAFQVIAVPS